MSKDTEMDKQERRLREMGLLPRRRTPEQVEMEMWLARDELVRAQRDVEQLRSEQVIFTTVSFVMGAILMLLINALMGGC